MVSINTVYEPRKAEASTRWRQHVMFLDNFEISFLRFSPLPGLMHRSMSCSGSTQRRVCIAIPSVIE